MPLDIPENARQIRDRIRADVQAEAPNSNPFLRVSWLGSLISGLAYRVQAVYRFIAAVYRQAFPQTATGEALTLWGDLKAVTQLEATNAIGSVIFTGGIGLTIDAGTLVSDATTTNQYRTTASGLINGVTLSLTSLTAIGQTATGVTGVPHGLVSGQTATIAGATSPGYNGSWVVTVIDDFTFTFVITSAAASPALGSITMTVVRAIVPVVSIGTGDGQNLGAGAPLVLTTPQPGVSSVVRVAVGGLSGGAAAETADQYRTRVLEAWQTASALFTPAFIRLVAKQEPGVTRVFVLETTPVVGAVTVYFVRDNDADIIPSPAEVTAVRNRLLSIKPAHMTPDDLVVQAPVSLVVPFAFTALSPNTATMQAAIVDNLRAFMQTAQVGKVIDAAAYTSAINGTIDETGAGLTGFSLAAPAGAIVPAADTLPVLGGVTFP